MAILFFSNLLKAVQTIYLSAIQSFQVTSEDYYSRFTFKKGGASYYGWIRVYSDFIIAQTNKEARLLVPPQEMAYKMEGNINYFRWFMHPRRLYHSEDLQAKDIEISHIIISAGDCETNDCVWPNYFISKSKIKEIILIDRETQKVSKLEEIDYKPDDFYGKWGIMILK